MCVRKYTLIFKAFYNIEKKMFLSIQELYYL